MDEDNAETDKAFEGYKKTLNLDPGNTDLAIRVAGELARRDDVIGGINLLKDSIKAAPRQPLPYLALAQIYSKYLHKSDLAIKFAATALELEPDELAPYFVLYELYTAGNQTKNASQLLDRAMKQENPTPEYWFQLGEMLTAHFIKNPLASNELKRVPLLFQKSLALAGDDPVLMNKIADDYFWLKMPDAAIPLYSKLLTFKPDPSDPSRITLRDQLARSYILNGEADQALLILHPLIQEYPLRSEGYELMGSILEQKGDLASALVQFNKMLELDPSRPPSYLRVADLCLKLKQFEKGVQLLVEAHRKFSELPLITYSLAVAQSRAGRYQGALTSFEEAQREAETSEPGMLDANFYFAYGSTAQMGGQLDRAVELLRKSIDLDPPNSAVACNLVGYIWVERGEHLEEAARFIKRALELDPGNPAYLDSLGWYYFKSAHYDKALVELLKAADGIRSGDVTVYEHLGDTYSKLKNTAQALIYWQKAVHLDPLNQAILSKIEDSKQKLSANPAKP